jgi:hypothetical protein
MINIASASPEIKREALDISGEIPKNIEESDIPLSNIALKAIRLAKLLNDSDYIKIFQYEVNGYPNTGKGIHTDIWKLAIKAKKPTRLKTMRHVRIRNLHTVNL